MKGNLYQHIKIRHAYDFSLCFPHELLMSFWIYNSNSKVSFYTHLALYIIYVCLRGGGGGGVYLNTTVLQSCYLNRNNRKRFGLNHDKPYIIMKVYDQGIWNFHWFSPRSHWKPHAVSDHKLFKKRYLLLYLFKYDIVFCFLHRKN
jgi:hypothetical protein